MNKKSRTSVIFITGAPFTTNYGVMALVISAIRAIERLLPTPSRYIIGSVYQDFDSRRYKAVLHEYDVKIIGVKHINVLPMPLRVPLLLLKSIPHYISADLILEMPGEVTTTVSLISQCFRLMLGVFLRKFIVIYAPTLGPFRSGLARLLARVTYNSVGMITTREKLTRNYLLRIGVNNVPIYLTADHTFLLEPASEERINEILMIEGIAERDRPLVGFSPKQDYTSEYEGYTESMIRVVDYVIERLDATVILIHHTAEDAPVAKKMLQMVKQKHKVKLIAGEYFPDELKGVISRCDMFVGCRMHSCIASSSMCVPTVTIIPVSEHKALGIMQMLNQAERVVNPYAPLHVLFSKIELCWSGRWKIREELEKRVSVAQELALLNAKLLSEVLSRRGVKENN